MVSEETAPPLKETNDLHLMMQEELAFASEVALADVVFLGAGCNPNPPKP